MPGNYVHVKIALNQIFGCLLHSLSPFTSRMKPLLFLLPILLLSTLTSAHNITKILAKHPEFSTFNHYLTATNLASKINRRLTITVLTLDNRAMSALLAHRFSIPVLKNVLSLHVLFDYYGTKRLHRLIGGSTLSPSFFQSFGSTPGTTGFINIIDHRKGHVTFSAADDASPRPVSFVKSIKEMPYNLSILQISAPLSSPEAEAPIAAPAPVNLTSVLSKNGCKMFADLLTARPAVLQTYEYNAEEDGLTVFCPVDGALKAFLHKYKNLTAKDKASVLLYHATAFYSSMQMLRQNNGLSSTLATERYMSYVYIVENDGEVVTLETEVTTAKIGKTVLDRDPVAIYSIDKVLEPKELFKAVEAPTEAPEADVPEESKNKKTGR